MIGKIIILIIMSFLMTGITNAYCPPGEACHETLFVDKMRGSTGSAISIGTNAIATGFNSFAMGFSANTNGDNSISFGRWIRVTGGNSIGFSLYNYTNTTKPIITRNNVMAIMGGEIGIGTTNPQARLDVVGKTKTNTLEVTSDTAINNDLEVNGETKTKKLYVGAERTEIFFEDNKLCYTDATACNIITNTCPEKIYSEDISEPYLDKTACTSYANSFQGKNDCTTRCQTIIACQGETSLQGCTGGTPENIYFDYLSLRCTPKANKYEAICECVSTEQDYNQETITGKRCIQLTATE